MNNFCNQCGNPLNGKNKCDKCGHVVSNEFVNHISDKVKEFDYKGKAEQIKESVTNFDYKAKPKNIKKIITVLAIICLFIGFYSCHNKKNNIYDDIQGLWYDENSSMALGFEEDDSFLIYGFGTNIKIEGTYDVDKDSIILHPNKGDKDMIFSDVKVKDNILSHKSESGKKVKWKELEQNELDDLYEQYDIKE